jgi:tight adherence protein C
MVVCVEAGLPLEAAFIRVGNDTATSHPRIGEEFRTVTEELQAGRTRQEALHSLANRTQVDVVKSFVALLIQTDSLGGSIAQSLRVYAAEMRQHRMLKAEEKAMRIPVLLSVPLVLCILPVIMTAVLLPAAITLAKDFTHVVH